VSKAFTRETDGDDEDDGIALPPLPVGGKNYITPAGYARLRAELLGLMDEERPKVVEAVHWAAKNGDRSENGDYLYGKKRLREIDRRIRFLTKRLEIAEVTDPSALTLPLFRVALNPRFTRPFYAVPRTSAARTASG
jgi:transcription elongation factor GreB